jgi:hypothetical protein
MRTLTTVVVLTSVLLAGCCLRHRCVSGLYGDDEFQQYVQRIDQMRMSSGDPKEVNRVTQTDSPWPPYVQNPRIPVDGQRMTNAVENYRAGPASGQGETDADTDATPEWPSSPPPAPSPAPTSQGAN